MTIRGVPDLLREALGNLLDNAIRFSPTGGRIVVRLCASRAGGARMTVCDSGPGLPPEQKATVFRAFERAGSQRRESVGLGLVIVADICRAHAATFGVEDNPGGGCCFWLEFPRDRSVEKFDLPS